MELSQADTDKIKRETCDLFYQLEMYLVSTYEDLPRDKARKFIQEQIKKIMSEMK